MKANMLASQFEALEEPQDALTLDITLAPHHIVDRVVEAMRMRDGAPTER
jgi:gluconate kinase